MCKKPALICPCRVSLASFGCARHDHEVVTSYSRQMPWLRSLYIIGPLNTPFDLLILPQLLSLLTLIAYLYLHTFKPGCHKQNIMPEPITEQKCSCGDVCTCASTKIECGCVDSCACKVSFISGLISSLVMMRLTLNAENGQAIGGGETGEGVRGDS